MRLSRRTPRTEPATPHRRGLGRLGRPAARLLGRLVRATARLLDWLGRPAERLWRPLLVLAAAVLVAAGPMQSAGHPNFAFYAALAAMALGTLAIPLALLGLRRPAGPPGAGRRNWADLDRKPATARNGAGRHHLAPARPNKTASSPEGTQPA